MNPYESRQNIRRWFQEAYADPDLQATVDIQALLDNDDDETAALTSLKDIQEKTWAQLVALDLPSEEILCDYFTRLADYQYMDEVNQILCGRFVRWIRKPGVSPFTRESASPGPSSEGVGSMNHQLSKGGFVTGVKFTNTGTVIMINMTYQGKPRCYSFKYDNYVFFQKLTKEELFVLNMEAHTRAGEGEEAADTTFNAETT